MPHPEARFAVLMFTDIVDSTGLKPAHGVPAYLAAFARHNALFESLARGFSGMQILQHTGDGFFASFGGVADAVRFALLFQDAMRREKWTGLTLTTRVGIHAGEVAATEMLGQANVLGPAADLTARVMSLAVGGQILLTRAPFDEARPFVREHPPVDGETAPALRWLAHGPYRMKGRDEPMEIFEVGAEGHAPLAPPPDSEKAKRAIRPGEEETLGWRPADGLEIPGRPGWRLVGKLGAGGFGEVWIGEHAKLHQRRAFKFCFDDERLRALKREVTLVRLLRSALGERDDIVHLHELKLDAPPFYLESDLAPHGNLLQWAEAQGGLEKIPLTQRIALVAHTATALAAAHSIGVLHKDIKPTNILIFDGPGGEPRPRLVDFGIGTLADPAALREFGITGAGFTQTKIEHSTGTPTYSPPEYVAGRPYTIQGDIYGLGVLLYQLVTAKPNEPIAPGWERDITDPLLREDIALCVDGDPARRLPSAADLAERLLTLDPRRTAILEKERLARESAARAEADAAAGVARARARRFRKLSAAFAVLALLAIGGGALAWLNEEKAVTALREVAAKKIEVEGKNAELERQKAEVDRKNTEYRAMLAEAARSDRLVAEEKLLAGHREAFAHLARACEYEPESTFAAEKAVAALNMWRHPLPKAVLLGHEADVSRAQFSPDGARIVTASDDNTARVWEASSGKLIATLSGHKDRLGSAQFSPDGAQIVTASYDRTARVWEASSGQPIATLSTHRGHVVSAEFSPDGTRIVTAAYDGTARVWEASSGRSLAVLSGHKVMVVTAQFSPDGARIVTASTDKTARVWEALSGQLIATLTGHGGTVSRARFSPDGACIVTASDDRTARVWETSSGDLIATLSGHEDYVVSVQFSPDGTRIVTASLDKSARVWEAASGQPLGMLSGHAAKVTSAQFSPDGARIVTASMDKTARVWDASSGQVIATLSGHEDYVASAQFSPDGTRIVTASKDKAARLWEAPRDRAIITLSGHEDYVASARFSPDGGRIVTASKDKTARVWEASSGNLIAMLSGHQSDVYSADFSPDGARIVTASQDRTARVWEASSGNLITILSGHKGNVHGADFSPDGARIVTASQDKTARVWEASSGNLIATLSGHEGNVYSAQFSPDGARIVTASMDKTARVWEASSGQPLATLSGHERFVWSAQFSPDGARIVTASSDQTARVWEASSGKLIATLLGHNGTVWHGQFRPPDGTRIVTASDDKTAGVWETQSGKLLVTLAGHAAEVPSAWFSPDGARIVTASWDRTARLWQVLPPDAGVPPEWFPDFLRYMAQMRLNSDGELENLKTADWLALRERMRAVRRASAGRDTPYLRILRRWVPE